jgi:hypothetical protein
MEKYKLLQIVKKTSKKFGDTTPTRVYDSLRQDVTYSHIYKVLKTKDIILYSLLVPYQNMGEDIDETYDRIEMNLFTVELVEVYDTEPDVECPECHGHRLENCDNCNGTGEVECRECNGSGEVDCDYCDGSGVYEDGEECDMCEGAGRMTCRGCNGNGNESCDYCGGDGENECGYCDGTGEILSQDKSIVYFEDYVSWSSKWKDYFFRGSKNEILDNEDIINFGHSKQTIRLNYDEFLSEDYQGYENGDVLLFRARLKDELEFVKEKNSIKVV